LAAESWCPFITDCWRRAYWWRSRYRFCYLQSNYVQWHGTTVVV